MWKAFGYRKKIKWYMAARWRRMFEGGSITSFWISGGIPEVLCISACIFPLSPEISWEAQNSVFPWQFSSLLIPRHNTHSFTTISLGTKRTTLIIPLSPTRTPGLIAHSWFLWLIKCISVCPLFSLVFQLASIPNSWNAVGHYQNYLYLEPLLWMFLNFLV